MLAQIGQRNCKAKVCELDLSIFQKYVRRFDVSMNIPCSVHSQVPTEDLLCDGGSFCKRKHLPCLEMLSEIALTELRHQICVVLGTIRVVEIQHLRLLR